MPPDSLDELVANVLSKPDYQHISPDLVRWIGEREIRKRRNLKEAVKFTRAKLHQTAGAYLGSRLHYALWLDELAALPHAMEDPKLKDFCRRLMARHASTRERLPILDIFFFQVLKRAAPIQSILDIGCGMNPLALPWMPLGKDPTYLGLDIFADQAEFLNAFLAHIEVRGEVQVYNLVNGLPHDLPHVQTALLLKTLSCLEQLDKTISSQLLNALPADCLVVSYPVHSLGGRSKGMLQNYEQHFASQSEEHSWQPERFEFKTELAYFVEL